MNMLSPWIVSFACLFVTVKEDDLASKVEAMLAEGRAADAREMVEKALEAGGDDVGVPGGEPAAELHVLCGRCLRAEGRLWDAEAQFAAALELEPSGASGATLAAAAVGRGRVFLDLAREATRKSIVRGAEVRALAADGTAALEDALRRSPGSPEVLSAMGEILLLAEDFEGAAKHFEDLVAATPGEPGPLRSLARAHRLAGDREAAAAAERRSLALDANQPAASAALAGDLLETGAADEARSLAREAAQSAPGFNDLYRVLWRIDVPAGRHALLEQSLVAILEKHPGQPTALYYLGFARLQAGRVDEALEAFRERQAVAPGNAEVLLQIARILVGKDLLDEAAAAYSDTLDASPEGSATWTAGLQGLSAVGRRHGLSRNYEKAESVFRRLTEVEDSAAEHWINVALSLRRMMRYEESETCYRAAIERAPFDGWPRNDLGLLYMAWGRRDDAIAMFMDAREVDPRLTDPMENLGALARIDGDRDEAVRWFGEAHDRALRFGDDEGRRKFRRLLDECSREPVSSVPGGGGR